MLTISSADADKPARRV